MGTSPTTTLTPTPKKRNRKLIALVSICSLLILSLALWFLLSKGKVGVDLDKPGGKKSSAKPTSSTAGKASNEDEGEGKDTVKITKLPGAKDLSTKVKSSGAKGSGTKVKSSGAKGPELVVKPLETNTVNPTENTKLKSSTPSNTVKSPKPPGASALPPTDVPTNTIPSNSAPSNPTNPANSTIATTSNANSDLTSANYPSNTIPPNSAPSNSTTPANYRVPNTSTPLNTAKPASPSTVPTTSSTDHINALLALNPNFYSDLDQIMKSALDELKSSRKNRNEVVISLIKFLDGGTPWELGFTSAKAYTVKLAKAFLRKRYFKDVGQRLHLFINGTEVGNHEKLGDLEEKYQDKKSGLLFIVCIAEQVFENGLVGSWKSHFTLDERIEIANDTMKEAESTWHVVLESDPSNQPSKDFTKPWSISKVKTGKLRDLYTMLKLNGMSWGKSVSFSVNGVKLLLDDRESMQNLYDKYKDKEDNTLYLTFTVSPIIVPVPSNPPTVWPEFAYKKLYSFKKRLYDSKKILNRKDNTAFPLIIEWFGSGLRSCITKAECFTSIDDLKFYIRDKLYPSIKTNQDIFLFVNGKELNDPQSTIDRCEIDPDGHTYLACYVEDRKSE